MIKEIEATKLDLKPGQVLVVTIKSDGVTMENIDMVRKGFQEKFPENDILVLAVAPQDSIDFSVVSAEEAETLKNEA